MSRDTILKHALELSVDDRVKLIGELLESMISADSCSELSPEQEHELMKRLEADRSDPDSAISWEDAEKQVTARR